MRASALAISLLIGSVAATSSAPFRTRQEVFWFGTAITNNAITKQERADECRQAGEDLTSEVDAAGNWGFASEGFQLSLRFERAVFLTGEAVIASLIVRNVSGGTLADSIALPDRTDFVVTNEEAERLDRIDIFRPNATEQEERRRAFFKSFSLELEADEQWKYKMVLSDMFDLKKPGTYYLRAMRRVWKPDGSAGEIVSGTAAIRIIERSVAKGSSKTGAAHLVSPPGSVSNVHGLSIPGVIGPPALTVSNTGTGLQSREVAVGPSGFQGAAMNARSKPSADTASTDTNPPASSDKGTSIPGNFAGPARIAALVVALLLSGAVLVFFAVRRSRHHS